MTLDHITTHRSGARPPAIPAELLPRHIALVMDGNGRWASERGLPRTAGHERGEGALMEVLDGCLELGIPYLTVYAFSTENWRRSPQEVRYILGRGRDKLRSQLDLFMSRGVRVRWSGRRTRLWRSVLSALEETERATAGNTALTLTLCVNYGGRAEIADAAAEIARRAAAGTLDPDKIDENAFSGYLDEPELPDVDLFLRTSGEQRLSNFLLWQSAYAELVFVDTLFPDMDRTTLWGALEQYARRDRRYGGVRVTDGSAG